MWHLQAAYRPQHCLHVDSRSVLAPVLGFSTRLVFLLALVMGLPLAVLLVAALVAAVLVVLVVLVLGMALAVDEGTVCWHICRQDVFAMVCNFHQLSKNLL